MLTDENQNIHWTDVENPKIKDDEILIKVCAFGVNRADLLQRSTLRSRTEEMKANKNIGKFIITL